MPPFTDLKRHGEVVELLFLYIASALGLVVSKPYGDSAPYDFLVDAAGHITRVQVKSASVAEYGAYRVCCASGTRSRKPYPVSAFSPVTCIRLRPGSKRPLERFREAWHLLWHR